MSQRDSAEHLLRGVSRETLRKLDIYEVLLRKWQTRINLVSSRTLESFRERHIADSAQLLTLVEDIPHHWLDLGSGGGFPGLVCAIVLDERSPDTRVTLIESDARKCAFLREVVRNTDLRTEVLNQRIENSDPQNADLITARALAPLCRLLPLAYRHLSPAGRCLFLKGAQYQEELDAVASGWHMMTNIHPSVTSPNSVILSLSEISHAKS